MEVRATILCVKKDGTAAKLSDEKWYNFTEPAQKFLANMKRGDSVIVEYEIVKGYIRNATKIMKDGGQTTPNVAEQSTTPAPQATQPPIASNGAYQLNKSNYGSPEDVAGKQVGCALGAAATVAGGCGFSDPEAAKEFTLMLADAFVEWMRLKK